MAVYTDFFLASAEELQKACPLRIPSTTELPWRPTKPFSNEALFAEFPTDEECDEIKKFDYYSQKNLLPDRLEELFLLLDGDEDQFSTALDRPPLMVPGDDPFGGILQMPTEFVRALAELPEERVTAVAEEWLGDKKAKRTVESLQKMAKKAIDQGKNMYLLMLV